jgi:hypothetical protein
MASSQFCELLVLQQAPVSLRTPINPDLVPGINQYSDLTREWMIRRMEERRTTLLTLLKQTISNQMLENFDTQDFHWRDEAEILTRRMILDPHLSDDHAMILMEEILYPMMNLIDPKIVRTTTIRSDLPDLVPRDVELPTQPLFLPRPEMLVYCHVLDRLHHLHSEQLMDALRLTRPNPRRNPQHNQLNASRMIAWMMEPLLEIHLPNLNYVLHTSANPGMVDALRANYPLLLHPAHMAPPDLDRSALRLPLPSTSTKDSTKEDEETHLQTQD